MNHNAMAAGGGAQAVARIGHVTIFESSAGGMEPTYRLTECVGREDGEPIFASVDGEFHSLDDAVVLAVEMADGRAQMPWGKP